MAILILCFTLFVAIFVPSIKTVFSLVGATSSVTLVFLLPAAIYIRCGPQPAARTDQTSYAGHLGTKPALLRAASWLLLLLGLAVMGVALGFDLSQGNLF
eukprot:scaffold13444_cov30-Tisochrysis_lutea.AAC.1